MISKPVVKLKRGRKGRRAPTAGNPWLLQFGKLGKLRIMQEETGLWLLEPGELKEGREETWRASLASPAGYPSSQLTSQSAKASPFIPRFVERKQVPREDTGGQDNPSMPCKSTTEDFYAAPAKFCPQVENTTASHHSDLQGITPGEKAIRHPTSRPSPTAVNLRSRDSLWTASWPGQNSNIHALSYASLLETRKSFTARLHTGKATIDPDETQPMLSSEYDNAPPLPSVSDVGIREHLRIWQALQDRNNNESLSLALPSPRPPDSTANAITQSIENDSVSGLSSVDESASGDESELETFDVNQEGDTSYHNFLQHGDVVQLGTNTEPMLFIRKFGKQAQFYNMQGEWFHKSTMAAHFAVSKMFSPREIAPILPYLPNKEIDSEACDKPQTLDSNVPREVTGAIIEKLKGFQKASADVYRGHLERLDRAHSLVAHKSEARIITLQDIALILLQKQTVDELTEVMLWTVHRVLSRNPGFRRQASFYHRVLPFWRVNSIKHMQDYEQVRMWLREYLEGVVLQATTSKDLQPINWRQGSLADSNPIPGFIQKAQRLIKSNRNHRGLIAPSTIGPSPHQNARGSSQDDAVIKIRTVTAFTSKERAIIEYLNTWCITSSIANYGSAFSLGSMLLRATGMYEGYELDDRTGSLLLKEMGVVAPWDDPSIYNSSLRLPLPHDPSTKQLQDSALDSVAALEQGNEGLEDSLAGLRKDWGNMTVFCIDSAGAQEIDDGVSLERIEGQDSTFWVHVHIANPSAFITPGGAVAQYAATLLQSIYLLDKIYPMLSPRLTRQHFSLAKDRPVLTVSAKISSDGEILEREITPGLIRNIKQLTPSQVGQELGFKQDSPQGISHVLTFGHHVDTNSYSDPHEPLSSSEISELRKLHELGLARRLKRSGGSPQHLVGANVHYGGMVPDPHVYIQQAGLGPKFPATFGRQIMGDPVISWEVREINTAYTSAQDEVMLVADLMVLAGEVAAQWCSERNIPIPYRGTVLDPSRTITAEAYKAKTIDLLTKENESMLFIYQRVYTPLLGQSTLRSTPLPHSILGAPAYTKVTSPLRRYPDMLAHWQLQAALLHEARYGRGSLIGSTDHSYLPFSHAQLDAILPTIEHRERDLRRVMYKSKKHWICQLLARAFYFKEAELPELIDVFVHTQQGAKKVTGENGTCLMKQLSGMDADLMETEVSKKEGGFRLGDWWVARIERVDTFAGRVKVVPVNLTSRQTVEPVWG
ncbi:MAG: hypothetical protein Q9181_006032 [Wetmoreana brouardii]